jgi:ubiquinone biosynthesis protein COQ4
MRTFIPLSPIESLSPFTRWRRGLAIYRSVLKNGPNPLGILAFGGYVNAKQVRRLSAGFLADPDGKRLFDERRSIDSTTIDLDALEALPPGTLGHSYARFLRDHELSSDLFQAPLHTTNVEAAYVAKRFRQTHDLWHVLTGLAPDLAGEIQLLAFTHAQTRTPSTGIIVTVGTLRLLRRGQNVALRVVRAYRAGRKAKRLGTFDWEACWSTPVAELRDRLRVPALA